MNERQRRQFGKQLNCQCPFQQPENIVLKDKDAKQLKIIDFGTAQDLTKNPAVKAMVGTPEFICEY